MLALKGEGGGGHFGCKWTVADEGLTVWCTKSRVVAVIEPITLGSLFLFWVLIQPCGVWAFF